MAAAGMGVSWWALRWRGMSMRDCRGGGRACELVGTVLGLRKCQLDQCYNAKAIRSGGRDRRALTAKQRTARIGGERVAWE